MVKIAVSISVEFCALAWLEVKKKKEKEIKELSKSE
jgi:hypothetical protein